MLDPKAAFKQVSDIHLGRTGVDGKSADGRQALSHSIANLFAEQSLALTDRERQLMFDILMMVVADMEMTVRRAVAERLKDLDDAPRALVKILANDDISVAAPILEHSNALKDSDLIEVIRHRTLEHQMTVAIRRTLNEDISDALVEYGDTGVIETLLNNPNARISGHTMAYLVEQSERIDSFQEPILRREDLDPSLARKMLVWVSDELRQYTLANFDIDPATVDGLFDHIASDVEDRDEDHGATKAALLSTELLNEGLMTRGMLLSTLREGEVALFFEVYRTLLNIPLRLAKNILLGSDGRGLAVGCKYLGLAEDDFIKISSLCGKAHALKAATAGAGPDAMRAMYRRISDDDAVKVVGKWRRGADYKAAIEALDLAAGSGDDG